MNPDTRRITITLDIPDDALLEISAAAAFLDLINALHSYGTTPNSMTLEICDPHTTD